MTIQEIERLTLVYMAESGELFRQPAADLPSVGTLIDPETGDDMDLIGWEES